MKKAIVKLGFCLFIFCAGHSAWAGVPTVTISTTNTTPTNATTLHYDIVFNEAVTGFDQTDITVAGSGMGTPVLTLNGTGPGYTLDITGHTNGVIDVSIAAGKANSVSTSQGNTASNTVSITFDNVKPTPSINHLAPDPTTGGNTITFTVDFGEVITTSTFIPSTISFTGSGAGPANLSVTAPDITTSDNRNFNVVVHVSAAASAGTVIMTIPAGTITDPAGNSNNVQTVVDNTVQYNGVLPVVVTPTATGIDADQAILGGNVSAGGGSTVTERGIYIDTNPGVTTGDMKFQAAVGGTGVFTVAVNLTTVTTPTNPAATHFYFKAYAINALGTVSFSPERDFWSLSLQPNNSATVPTPALSIPDSNDPGKIRIEFDAANTMPNTEGYVILRRENGEPPVTDLPDGIHPNDLVANGFPSVGTTIVAHITDQTKTFYEESSVPACKNWYYVAVLYNWDLTHPETTNYRPGGPTFNDSNIITWCSNSTLDLQGPSTAQLNFASKTAATIGAAGDGLEVMQLRLKDGGGSADADDRRTELASITITLNHPELMNAVAYIDGGYVQSQPAAASMTFNLPSNTTVATDNNNRDVSFYATFKASPVIDQTTFVMTVTSVTARKGVNSAGSDFASGNGGGATTGSPNDYRFNVVATKMEFTNVSAAINPNSNFTIEITAMDAANNIDTNIGGNITLSKTAGSGSFNSGDGLTKAIDGTGKATWTQLQMTQALGKTIKADHSGSIADAFKNITVISLGTKVSFGSPTPTFPGQVQQFYFGNTDPTTGFQTLFDIEIRESDASDFGMGDGQTYSMLLPPGFIFDTRPAATPTLTVSSGGEISNAQFDRWVGNNVVIVKYNISNQGTGNVDVLTIKNLKVKYTSTTPVTNQAIIRVGGSAVQDSNAETDYATQPHSNISTISNTTVVFENVPAGAITATQTAFSKLNDPPITLQGRTAASPAGSVIPGTFSGDGVANDGGVWKFTPSSVSLGDHAITFTYTDGSGFVSTFTKTYNVFSSIINGLNTSYCINDAPVTLGPPTGSAPTGTTCLNLSALFIPAYINSDYTYKYLDYVWSGPTLISTQWVDIPDQDHFNPGDATWSEEVAKNGFVYLSVWYNQQCNPIAYPNVGYNQYGAVAAQVSVVQLPATSFAPTFTWGVCASDSPYDMTGSDFNAPGGDTFWSSPMNAPGTPGVNSAPGIVAGPSNTYKFDPGVANNTTSDKKVQINYRHKDAATTCVNQVSQVIDVWAKPAAIVGGGPPNGKVFIRGIADTDAQFCFGESLTPFSTPAVSNVVHKWTIVGGARPPVEGDEFALSPNDFANTAGVPDIGATADYKLTQIVHRQFLLSFLVFNGCESNPTDLTVEIMEPTTVDAGTASPICEGNPLFLITTGADIDSPHVGLAATWSSTSGTPGTFKDGAGLDITTGNVTNVFGQATRYFPSAAEIEARTVTLRLTTADPNGPCGPAFDDVFVTINPGVTVSFPVSPVRVCSTAEIAIEGRVSNTALDFDWSVVPSQGLGSIKVGESHNKNVTTYQPDVTELNQGGAVTLKLETADPDGPLGPCGVVSGTVQVLISQKPLIQAGTDFEICADQTINLTGVKPGGLSSAGSWTWTHDGAGTVGDDHALLTTYIPDPVENPGPVDDAGSKKITFTLTSNTPAFPNQCPAETDQVVVTIHQRPVAPEPSSAVPPTYCVGQNVDLLRANGTSLTWYDELMSQLSTGPSLATGVTADIEKKVTFFVTQTFDKVISAFAGCESSATPIVITVNPNPTPAFDFAKQCLGDFMEFTDQSTLAQPTVGSRSIVSWQWNFDDGLGFTDAGAGAVPAGTQDNRTTGDYNAPMHQFKNTGNYNVRLNLVTSDGCTASLTHTPIKVGEIPQAKFASRLVCDADDTEFKFTGAAPEAGSTFTYGWDFGDLPSGSENASTEKDPKHKFTGVNTYDVKLTVTTELNCSQSIIQKTSILPYIKTFPYVQNFESANHGWVAEGFSASSWNILSSTKHITPDPGPGAGNKFWVTNTDVSGVATYNDGERSVLYGPCVDMSQLSRPVLAMDYWLDTESKGDGAYIEVMDESVTNPVWVRLGDNVSGLNWYNESSIGGLARLNDVGQDISQFGWSGVSTEWKTGRFNLDDLTEKTRLRFRVVFGSNNSQPLGLVEPFDGFALDYFKLETRNRVVLVENFTSRSASTAVTGNSTAFQNFPSAAASGEVVKIEYHTGLPAVAGDPADAIFTQNPMDPNARASFYGLSAVPRGYIDGYTNTAGNGMFGNAAGSISNWSSAYYSTESLVTSPLDITINTPEITNGTLRITGSVLVKEFDLKGNQYSIYVAVVEETVGADAFVLRKMLPSASGRKVPATAAGQAFTFDESWSIDKSYLTDNPKLIAVAFVQADILNSAGTRQVLQAAYNANVPLVNFTTGLEPVFLEQTAIHPNPADGLVNIELQQATATGVEVKVLDQTGRHVLQSAIGIGQRSTTIDTSGLAGAVYIVQLQENGVFTARKLVITHRH